MEEGFELWTGSPAGGQRRHRATRGCKDFLRTNVTGNGLELFNEKTQPVRTRSAYCNNSRNTKKPAPNKTSKQRNSNTIKLITEKRHDRKEATKRQPSACVLHGLFGGLPASASAWAAAASGQGGLRGLFGLRACRAPAVDRRLAAGKKQRAGPEDVLIDRIESKKPGSKTTYNDHVDAARNETSNQKS